MSGQYKLKYLPKLKAILNVQFLIPHAYIQTASMNFLCKFDQYRLLLFFQGLFQMNLKQFSWQHLQVLQLEASQDHQEGYYPLLQYQLRYILPFPPCQLIYVQPTPLHVHQLRHTKVLSVSTSCIPVYHLRQILPTPLYQLSHNNKLSVSTHYVPFTSLYKYYPLHYTSSVTITHYQYPHIVYLFTILYRYYPLHYTSSVTITHYQYPHIIYQFTILNRYYPLHYTSSVTITHHQYLHIMYQFTILYRYYPLYYHSIIMLATKGITRS